MARAWTQDDKGKLEGLLDDGKKHDEIAKELGRPRSGVKTQSIALAVEKVSKDLLSSVDAAAWAQVQEKDLAPKPPRAKKNPAAAPAPVGEGGPTTNISSKLDLILSKLDEVLSKIQ